MTQRRLGRWALVAMTCLALVWSARLNLLAGPVTWDEDETGYFGLAASLGRALYQFEPAKVVDRLISTYRSPLTVTTDALTLLAAPLAPGLLAVSRVLWVLLLLWAVGGLARDLAERAGRSEVDRDRAAALAIVLTGTAPTMLQLGASLMSEVPLAALFTLALWLLLRTAVSREPREAWLLGLVVGLGLLVKWTLPISLAGPLLVAVLIAPGKAEIGKLALRVAAAAVLVAGPWYALAGHRVVAFVTEVGTGSGAQAFGAGQRTFLEELGYYPLVLAGGLMWWPLAGLALWGCARSVKVRVPGAWVLLAAVLGPALLFGLLANKEVRYLLPALAAVAALGSVGLRPRAPMLAAALGLGLLGCVSGLWSQGEEPPTLVPAEPSPDRILQADGSGVSATVALRTPLGPLSLWGSHNKAFPYRRPLRPVVPIGEIDALVQRTNPGGPREATVLSPDPWLWTPLWARAVRERGWTTWRSAACDPRIVSEAAYFLEVEPAGEMQHCSQITQGSRAQFEGIRRDLQRLGRWTVEGRRLTLWVHRSRLYPNAEVPEPQ